MQSKDIILDHELSDVLSSALIHSFFLRSLPFIPKNNYFTFNPKNNNNTDPSFFIELFNSSITTFY